MRRGAAAALHAALAGADEARRACAARCAAAGRREQLRAAALVLPLLLFLARVLRRADRRAAVARRDRPRVRASCRASPPHWRSGTAATCPPRRPSRRWSRTCARRATPGNLASAATRLNYDVNGFRTLFFATGAAAAGGVDGSAREALIAHRSEMGRARDLGGDPPRRRARHRFLPARARSTCGATPTARSSALRRSRRVFVNVLGRTLWISAMVTLVCLLLGLSGRVLSPRSRRAAPPCCCSSCCCRSGRRCSCAPSPGSCCCSARASSTASCCRSAS